MAKPKPVPPGELVSFPQSGEVLRGVMENAPIGMSLVDAGGRVVYANQAFADMFGRARSDCIGLEAGDLVAAEDVDGALYDLQSHRLEQAGGVSLPE